MTPQAGNDQSMTARLGVFLSGSGRTLLNLHDRCASGELDATIGLVVASKEGLGAQRARERGLTTLVLPKSLTPDELESLAKEHSLDLILLAGYLRMVPVPEALEGKILNIHPALLPGDGTPGRFGGKGMHGHHVHKAVIEAKESESGCTVHVVSAEYDAGPVLVRLTCPVLPGDTPDTLAARVFDLECEAYPQAVQQILSRARTTP